MPDAASASAGPILPSAAWRWIAFAAVAGNVAFNYLYARLGWGPDIKTVSDGIATSVTPAPFAFAIWGVIYLSFGVFVISSVRPSQRRLAAYDQLAPLLALANVLGALWIIAFTRGLIWPSVGVLALTLGVAAVLYRRATHERVLERLAWIRAPFALFFGWIIVATLADLAGAFAWSGLAVTPAIACTMVAVAAAAGLAVGVRGHDPIVPGVVAWATFAIAVATRAGDSRVEGIAMSASIACALACVAILVMRAWLPTTSHRTS